MRDELAFSCKTGEGLEEVKKAIFNVIEGVNSDSVNAVTSKRVKEGLKTS